jgi:hypothetical protein
VHRVSSISIAALTIQPFWLLLLRFASFALHLCFMSNNICDRSISSDGSHPPTANKTDAYNWHEISGGPSTHHRLLVVNCLMKRESLSPARSLSPCSFNWLISHQPTVLFSQNKSAISSQAAVTFLSEQINTNHQSNE